MKIVLTGGGTAGHVVPNLALLPNLKDKFSSIVYLGQKDSIEQRLAQSAGLEFFPVRAVKFDRSSKLSSFRIPFALASSVVTAKKLLRDLRPDIVFAKGGYVSLPASFAARSLGIPVVCHESDYSLGLANRLISRFAACTLTSFDDTAAKHAVFTGNPVREAVCCSDPTIAVKLCAFSRSAKTVLFIGGSSGAAAINSAVDHALRTLTRDFNVVHICGKGNSRPRSHGYRCFEFADDILSFFALADVVVSRAGANTACELMAMGKRVIFVPLPAGASRGDQLQNAQAYSKRYPCRILPQDRLNAYELVCAISDSLSRPSPQPELASLKAALAIADILAQVSAHTFSGRK